MKQGAAHEVDPPGFDGDWRDFAVLDGLRADDEYPLGGRSGAARRCGCHARNTRRTPRGIRRGLGIAQRAFDPADL